MSDGQGSQRYRATWNVGAIVIRRIGAPFSMKRDFDDFDREECFDSSYLDSERYAGESLYVDEYH